VAHIVREHGSSEATFYTWKTKYAGLQVSELTRFKHLEAENQRLKQRYAELSLENCAIKEVLRKNVTAPTVRRQVAHALVAQGLSQRRACQATGLARGSYGGGGREAKQAAVDGPVREALQALVERHRGGGFWKDHHRLRKNGGGSTTNAAGGSTRRWACNWVNAAKSAGCPTGRSSRYRCRLDPTAAGRWTLPATRAPMAGASARATSSTTLTARCSASKWISSCRQPSGAPAGPPGRATRPAREATVR